MRRIEKTELHILIRSHIISKLDTDTLPGRTAGNELVLHNPLDEILTMHISNVTRLGRRRNPVHHRIRESHIRLRPDSHLRILRTEILHERPLCRSTIMLQIVARKNRNRKTGRHTALQPLGNIPEDTMRPVNVNLITTFGNCQCYNLRRRRGNTGNNRLAILLAPIQFHKRTNPINSILSGRLTNSKIILSPVAFQSIEKRPVTRHDHRP